MSRSSANDSAPAVEVYRRRLKKEALAGRLIDVASAVTPRLVRRDIGVPKRIGILAQWGVGDAVLLLPLLRGLRQGFPEASLELIGKPWLQQLFSDEGCCDRTHVLVPPWTAYGRKFRQPLSVFRAYWLELRGLRRENFDWLISPRFDPREILQLRLLQAAATFGFRSAGGRYWITDDLGLTRPEYDDLHRSRLAMTISGKISLAVSDEDIFFRNVPEKRKAAWHWLVRNGYRGGPVLAVHTGAGHPNRRWREDYFGSVLEGVAPKPGMVVFIHDPGSDKAPWNGGITHAYWSGGLGDLKSLLSVSDIFLGPDSGVMHMAAAAGCRVVAIFGPGEPKWFGPAGDDHMLVLEKNMPCRPCFDRCIYSSPRCLEHITDAMVIRSLGLAIQAVHSAGIRHK